MSSLPNFLEPLATSYFSAPPPPPHPRYFLGEGNHYKKKRSPFKWEVLDKNGRLILKLTLKK